MRETDTFEPRVCLPPTARAAEARYLPDSGNDPCALAKGCATLEAARAWCDRQTDGRDYCIWRRLCIRVNGRSEETHHVAAVRAGGQWYHLE